MQDVDNQTFSKSIREVPIRISVEYYALGLGLLIIFS